MRTLLFYIVAFVALVITGGFIFLQLTPSDKPLETRLGITPSKHLEHVRLAAYDLPAFALFPFGIEHGFFEKEGISLDLIATNTQPFSGDIFNSDKFDMFTQGNTNFLNDRKNHMNEKWILNVVDSRGDIAFIANNKSIKSFADARGKKIAIVPNTEFLIYNVLKHFNIATSEVRIIPILNFPSIGARVASGEFDIGHVFRGLIEDPKVASSTHIIYTSADIPSAAAGGLVASNKFLLSHPESARALIRAYFNTLDYARAHPNDINEFYKRHYPGYTAKFEELTYHPSARENNNDLREGIDPENMFANTRYYTILLGHPSLDPEELYSPDYLPKQGLK